LITKKDVPALKERLRKILKEELGLASFEEDDDGDFVFRFERIPFLMVFEADDPAFLWIRRDNYRLKKPDAETLTQIDACINEANSVGKLVKLFRSTKPDPHGDYVLYATVAILIDDIATLSADTIDRCLFHIKVGSREVQRLLAEAAVAPHPRTPSDPRVCH
jgi:hypothetical protein